MPPCERISVCYPLSDYVCYVTFSNGKMRFCFDYYAIKK